MTDISAKTRKAVIAREQESCAFCGRHYRHAGGQVHHRRARKMGGSKDPATNSMENLVLVCPDDHAWIEANRKQATMLGWLCPSWADPGDWPVQRALGSWQQPTANGWVHVAAPDLRLVPVLGTARHIYEPSGLYCRCGLPRANHVHGAGAA